MPRRDAREGALLLLAELREQMRCDTDGCVCYGDAAAHAQHELHQFRSGRHWDPPY